MTDRAAANKALVTVIRSGVVVLCDLCGAQIARPGSARVAFDNDGRAIFRHKGWTDGNGNVRDCTTPRPDAGETTGSQR